MTTETSDHLSDQQHARLQALKASRSVVRDGGSIFGGGTVRPDISIDDLTDLAVFILTGQTPRETYHAFETRQREETS